MVSPCRHFIVSSAPWSAPASVGVQDSVSFHVSLVGPVESGCREVTVRVSYGGPTAGRFTITSLSSASDASALSRFIIAIIERAQAL